MWDESNEVQRLIWKMFSELILRVVGSQGNWREDAEIVPPTKEMEAEVRARWMKLLIGKI
jgi:hypothetical protein